MVCSRTIPGMKKYLADSLSAGCCERKDPVQAHLRDISPFQHCWAAGRGNLDPAEVPLALPSLPNGSQGQLAAGSRAIPVCKGSAEQRWSEACFQRQRGLGECACPSPLAQHVLHFAFLCSNIAPRWVSVVLEVAEDKEGRQQGGDKSEQFSRASFQTRLR